MMFQETLETIWACKLRKENLDALYAKLGGEGGLNGINCFCKINMWHDGLQGVATEGIITRI